MSALVPLYGFLEGDTLGLLILAHDDWSITRLGERVFEAARVRVEPSQAFVVLRGGRPLDPALTVAEVGLEALDRFDVSPRQPDDGAPT